jgi:nicotinamidase-related amidase
MHIEEFAKLYYQTLKDAAYSTPLSLNTKETVLIVIDAQKMLSSDGYRSLFLKLGYKKEDLCDALDEFDVMRNNTLSNIKKVIELCRGKQIRVIHVRIRALLSGSQDNGLLYKTVGVYCPPGFAGAEFLPEAMPLDNEIVLNKTCSGICAGTMIDTILRNLGIKNVLLAGFFTDQCVSSSARDLADLGYSVELIEDAMAALSPGRHMNALESMTGIYTYTETTDALIKRAQ